MPEGLESKLIFKETTSKNRDRRVALIQRWFKDRQQFKSTIDGLFGPKTTAAVKKFQAANMLDDTGIVDEVTGRMMGMPFWQADVQRTLDTPFRDQKLFDEDHDFSFRSAVGIGYFFSSWPDATRDSANCLTARALRTNNPGALNISKWQKKVNGYVGRTLPDNVGNETTIYEKPEDGVAAWGILIRNVYFKGSKDKVTIGQIVDKYRGGIPRKPYLDGYKRFSDGELIEDYEVDLYDNTILTKVAVAAFSHEFGSWYPLMNEQLLAGLAVSDVYVSSARSLLTISERELDPDFYRTVPEDGDVARDGFEDDGVEEFEEDLDANGFLTSLMSPETAKAVFKAPRLSLSDAHWPKDPKNAPDTWHVPGDGADVDFDLNYDLVQRLMQVGCFEPDTSTNGKFVLALRGCVIADGSSEMEDKASIKFRATKPNHEDFLCSIGIVDNKEQRLSFYQASTVPRRTGMLKYYNKINFGTAWDLKCNMLPTGCYEYCVGTHYGHAGKVPYVLRLGNGPEPKYAGEALVLRTTNDLVYGTQDIWDRTRPGDNIHPAFLSVSFSSIGCLTLHGTQAPGGKYSTATGQWKLFRKMAGFENKNHGKRFDAVIVTGHEAAAVAAVGGGSIDTLMCLRQGSRGEIVGHLQGQLGLKQDNVFSPLTAETLVALQRKTLGFATGTWTREMATKLGLKL
ncbi:peptidoglycan-binding domain-containing protein [Mesorhizobium sp. M0767]|uniref:peptidoglycan-binding domain-containing protein n=1 Tax=Mesorhizobium sp. M0767 TaxID=2956995 RepID=UPI00333CF9CF